MATTKAGGVRGWQLATGIRGISLFTSLSHERDDDNDRENRENKENEENNVRRTACGVRRTEYGMEERNISPE